MAADTLKVQVQGSPTNYFPRWYVASDTRCPALQDYEFKWGREGQWPQRLLSPVDHRGTFVHLSIHLPIRPSVRVCDL